jgi:hypothetical protein
MPETDGGHQAERAEQQCTAAIHVLCRVLWKIWPSFLEVFGLKREATIILKTLCTRLSVPSNNSNDAELQPLQIHGIDPIPRLLALVLRRHLLHTLIVFLVARHPNLECPKLHLCSPPQTSSVLLVEDEDT